MALSKDQPHPATDGYKSGDYEMTDINTALKDAAHALYRAVSDEDPRAYRLTELMCQASEAGRRAATAVLALHAAHERLLSTPLDELDDPETLAAREAEIEAASAEHVAVFAALSKD
ncbi:hypothetical protein [Thiolapillus sp.]|uniref:hypothetical protein n=1 Tax=Thiolapillus sp. TaxID=2017437 RepID=UPI003AF6887B